MSLKLKRVFKVIIFICFFLCLFYVVTVTLKFKEDIGIHQMTDFYKLEDNSLDVINIGSSHVGVNVDPEILLEQYGIKSYNLWASVQPAWNSYYYLKEALKTQNPELVCVETFVMVQDIEYSDYSRAIYNTLGMKASKDKFDAINVSIGEDLREDFYLEWPTFHTRYTDLKEADFQRYFWNYHFSSGKIDSGYNSYENDIPEIVDKSQTEALYKKQEEYLRKIIQLCQTKKIPLLLFNSPYSASEEDQKRFNEISTIAEEYNDPNVVYKDFMYDIDEIPVDFASDYADGGGHFNNYGIEKFSMYFGKYLKENFDITTRSEEYSNKFNLQKLYGCAYRMPEVFSGNGASAYVDTNQKLYDDPDRSWTLLADFSTRIDSEDQVYLSCYCENEDSQGGLLIKRKDDTLYFVLGDNYYIDVPVPTEDYARVAITKDGSIYNIYLNGKKITDDEETTYESEYDGDLVLGCELDQNGQPYRYSAPSIYETEVYNEIISEKDIMQWENTERTAADSVTAEIQDSVAYYLDKPFTGNGVDETLDTGIHLYDDPMRNWTLLTEVDLTCDKSVGDLVYMSCFNEEADNYHGLIIRYKDDKIEAIVGNTYYLDIPDNGLDSMKIAIVKNGSSYTVYVDGKEFASDIQSYCSSYMGDLILGSQEESGEKIRISPTTVKQLEVYDEVVSGDEIATW